MTTATDSSDKLAAFEHTIYHLLFEAFLLGLAGYFYLQRRREQRKMGAAPRLTAAEEEELLAAWDPDPLVEEVTSDHFALKPRIADGRMTKEVLIEGQKYLNLVANNFLGLVGNERIESRAKQTIGKYGVGSCGPRGFYGTLDVHLDLEKAIASFLHCEEAALYSYGFATIASAIPSYAKKGDIIFVDKGVNFAIQKGVQASRSHVVWFEHNDMEDLEKVLQEQDVKDKKNPRKAQNIRRFLVVEGLYANSASICPLPKLLEFKWKFKLRIFIDESLSFGVLGKTGRGVIEHYGVDPINVDLVMASLENALASTGGFCAGRSFVVGHQRLSDEALDIIQEEPTRIARLQENARQLAREVEKTLQGSSFMLREGEEQAPFRHIVVRDTHIDRKEKELMLDGVVEKMFASQVLVARSRYLDESEMFQIEPSIRITTQSELTDEELSQGIAVLQKAVFSREEEEEEEEEQEATQEFPDC